MRRSPADAVGRMICHMKSRATAILIVLLGLAVTRLARADVSDLNRDLPLRVQDTRPAEKGQWQLQDISRWENTDAHEDRLTLQPQVQYGATENLQLQLQAPFYLGDADRRGSGDVQLGALYRFLTDDGSRPSIAIAGQLIAPTGVGSDGLDTELELDLSKGLGGGSNDDNARHRVHLNLVWDHNSIPARDERQDRYQAVLGYSFQINEKTLLLADFVREQQPQERQDSNLLEIGLVRDLTEKLSIAVGASAGIGDDSPACQITFAIQLSL